MKKALLFLLFLSAIRPVSYSQTDQNITKISAYLDELGNDENFSLAIAISRGEKLILQKAYGHANREHKAPNTVNASFNIASIGKMFTAVGILQLYDEGKVELNLPIGKYLPDFPNKEIRDSITIHQLLTHASGLPLMFSQDFDANTKFQYAELKDYLPFYNNISIDHKKAGKHYYSNVGFFMLGFIIEKVSGLSYKNYLNEHIFKPLQMNNTGIYKLTDIIPNAANGYMRPASKNDVWKNNYSRNMSSGPAGGAYASVLDLITFYNALQHNKLLKPKTTGLMCSPEINTPEGQYGYGFMITENNKHLIEGHMGAYYGIRGELMEYKDNGYTVAILANTDQTDYDDVSYFIKTILTGTTSQQENYSRTLKLARDVISGSFIVNDANCKPIAGESYDEDLIEIKGYYYFNNNGLGNAVALFKLNTLLFPNSTNAKNSLNRAIKRRDE